MLLLANITTKQILQYAIPKSKFSMLCLLHNIILCNIIALLQCCNGHMYVLPFLSRHGLAPLSLTQIRIFSLMPKKQTNKKTESWWKPPRYIKLNYIKCLFSSSFYICVLWHLFYPLRCLFYDVQGTHGVCHYTSRHNQTFFLMGRPSA